MNRKYTAQDCENAYGEIRALIAWGTIRSSQYVPWLEKWQKLKACFELPPLYGPEKEFHSIYWDLYLLKEFLSFHKEAEDALAAYFQLGTNNEDALLLWLVKHENMHKQLGYFIYNTMCAELDEGISVIDTGKAKVDAEEFMALIKFCNVYDPLYFKKLKQYRTYTLEEEAQLDYYNVPLI